MVGRCRSNEWTRTKQGLSRVGYETCGLRDAAGAKLVGSVGSLLVQIWMRWTVEI